MAAAALLEPSPVFTLELRHHAARVGRAWRNRVLIVAIAALVLCVAIFYAGEGGARAGPERISVAFSAALVGAALLFGPALTAGAICQDKRRGLIDHFLVTDLSAAEIVLGKLAARLWLCLEIAAIVPVILLVSILCDVDPSSIARSTLIAAGILVLGATLALAFSVWGTKTHEALTAAYLTFGGWMLSAPLGWAIAFYLDKPAPPSWFRKTNPFWLALAPVFDPLDASFGDVFVFLTIVSAISALLCAAMIVTLRRFAQGAGVPKAGGRRAKPKRIRFLIGPPIDPNPVLWREWRRLRSSRWSERIWLAYAVGAILCGAVAVDQEVSMRIWMGSGLATTVNVTQAIIGLLLFCVAAASAWAEERGRAGLDALLSTPLSTKAIVWGKWWGIYRVVPAIALICAFVTIGPAWRNGRVLPPFLAFFSVCGQGALWTGVGLLAATWFKRDAQAVVAAVAAFLVFNLGGYFLLRSIGSSSIPRQPFGIWFLYWADPIYTVGELTIGPEWAYGRYEKYWHMWIYWVAAWDAIDAALAFALVSAAISSFSRSFDRMPDSSAAAGSQPRAFA